MLNFLFRTNLPKEVMAFPNFPFQTSMPSYIVHQDVLEYLKSYAAYYNLFKYIKVWVRKHQYLTLFTLHYTPRYSVYLKQSLGNGQFGGCAMKLSHLGYSSHVHCLWMRVMVLTISSQMPRQYHSDEYVTFYTRATTDILINGRLT